MNKMIKTGTVIGTAAIAIGSGFVCIADTIASRPIGATHVSQGKFPKKVEAAGTKNIPVQKATRAGSVWIELPPVKKGAAIRTVHEEADYDKTTDVAVLEAKVDLVIIGKPVQDFLDRRHIATYFPDGNLNIAGSEGVVQVQSVLKNSRQGQMAVPAFLQVAEPAGLIKDGLSGGFVKLLPEEYREMQKGSSYILFLRRNKRGSYTVQNFNLGKFNIDGTDPNDDPEQASAVQTGQNNAPSLETGQAAPGQQPLTEKQTMKAQLEQRYRGRF